MLADHLEAGVAELRGPEIEIPQGGQLDELLGAGRGDGGEGQTEALEVAQGAATQQQRHVGVRSAHRQCKLARTALLLLRTHVGSLTFFWTLSG